MSDQVDSTRMARAIARRQQERDEYISSISAGRIMYLMGPATFAKLLIAANANVSFDEPNWAEEYPHRLRWTNLLFLELGITAMFGKDKIFVSNECKQEGVFEIRYGGPATLPAYKILTDHVIGIKLLTVEEFAALIPKEQAGTARSAQYEFHVCKCDPPPEPCMCDFCHTCRGVKPEYADKYRNSPWYKEKS